MSECDLISLFQSADDDGMPDFANMTEEEQIAFAMQMSMQDQRKFTSLIMKMLKMYIMRQMLNFFCLFIADDTPVQQAKRPKQEETPMEVDDVIIDPDFLQSVLENLPGVDPQSETIRDAVGSLNKDKKADKDKDKA